MPFPTTGSTMSHPQARLHPKRAQVLVLVAVAITACGHATGPERRHLAAVELAEEAIALPRSEPRRRVLLTRAEEELRAALERSPRLSGANTTLAGILIALDEPIGSDTLATANGLLDGAPTEQGLQAAEVAARASLRALIAARRGDWTRVDELTKDHPELIEIASISDRYRAHRETPPTCSRPPDPAPQIADEPAPMSAPSRTRLAHLTTLREGFCEGLLGALALVEALGTEVPPTPRLALAHHRLRAAALAELGRWSEALDALESGRAAALLVVGTDVDSPLVAALDLDRALALAWLDHLQDARIIVSDVLARHDAPRAKALAELLAP